MTDPTASQASPPARSDALNLICAVIIGGVGLAGLAALYFGVPLAAVSAIAFPIVTGCFAVIDRTKA